MLFRKWLVSRKTANVKRERAREFPSFTYNLAPPKFMPATDKTRTSKLSGFLPFAVSRLPTHHSPI
jgi:hypothetical protein